MKSNCEGSRATPESSQARMTLVEALRYHASLMIAPEVAPKVRALLNDASTVMWAAAEALSTESEKKPSMDISFCPGCEKEWNRATPSAVEPIIEERRLLGMVPHHLRGLLERCPHYNGTANLLAAIEAALRAPPSATGASVTPKEIVELAKEMYLTAIGDRGYNLTITFARVEAISKALLKIASPDWLETVTKNPADRRGVQK